MATRNGRHHHVVDMLADPDNNVHSNENNSRFDSGLSKNWTVAQLRVELSRYDITFNKSDKKLKLLQLCKDNGLVTPTTLGQEVPIPVAREGAVDLSQITKTVQELTESVTNLSRRVDSIVTKDNTVLFNPGENNLVDTIPADTPMDYLQDTSHQALLAGSPHQTRNSTSSLNSTAIGIRTKFGYSAESLPFIETVHPSLKKHIIEGRDINLAALLIPYYTGVHSDPSKASKDRPDPRLNTTLMLPQFIQAFGIYKNIMCETYPNRRVELDLYERDIMDMASPYPGKGFYEYHKSFSAEAAAHLKYANLKVDWSVRNNKLFSTIFINSRAANCFMCNSSLNLTSFCPKQLENDRIRPYNQGSPSRNWLTDVRGRTRVLFNGKEICNNYNAVKGCKMDGKCNNLHVCLRCKKEHPQHLCNVVSKTTKA